MFVQVAVETPVSLSKKQKDLLKAFEAESPHEKHSPEAHGFFDKVKDLWEDLKE
jgi:molecular chaperone DnaJ